MVRNHQTPGSDELVRECERCRRRARGNGQLAEDVLDVSGDRVLADEQLASDLAVALPARDQSQHLEFAASQPMRTGGSGCRAYE